MPIIINKNPIVPPQVGSSATGAKLMLSGKSVNVAKLSSQKLDQGKTSAISNAKDIAFEEKGWDQTIARWGGKAGGYVGSVFYLPSLIGAVQAGATTGAAYLIGPGIFTGAVSTLIGGAVAIASLPIVIPVVGVAGGYTALVAYNGVKYYFSGSESEKQQLANDPQQIQVLEAEGKLLAM